MKADKNGGWSNKFLGLFHVNTMQKNCDKNMFYTMEQ